MKKFNRLKYNSLEDMSEYSLTPRQAILAKCKECCGFSMYEACNCDIKTCALHNLLVRYTKKSLTRMKHEQDINIE